MNLYRRNVLLPSQALLEGIRAGQGIREQEQVMQSRQMAMDAAQEEALAKKAQQEQQAEYDRMQAEKFNRDLMAAREKGTARATMDLMAAYPNAADKFKALLGAQTEEEKIKSKRLAMQTNTALRFGDTETASSLILDKAKALESAGKLEDARGFYSLAESIKTNPKDAQFYGEMVLASLLESPEEKEEYLSKIDKREIERDKAPLDIQKLQADLGLTKANTAKVIADTKKLNNDLKKSALELEAMKNGTIPRDDKKIFDFEKDLRKEYVSRTADFSSVRDSYRRIEAAEETGAGDLALIFSYMKMLDPGSTVMEGEFANAENSSGVSDKVRNLYNKILSGERLSSDQRKMFSNQAKKLLEASLKTEKEVRDSLEKVVSNYNLNPENIFPEVPDEVRDSLEKVVSNYNINPENIFPEVPDIGPSEIIEVTTQEEYDSRPSGAIFIEDGKQYRKP